MIMKHTGGGGVQFSLSGLVSLITVIGAVVGAGIYIGSKTENIGANAQEVAQLKTSIGMVSDDLREFTSDIQNIDKRLVQVETTTNVIRSQQIKVQTKLGETRETQAAIVANQKTLGEKLDRLTVEQQRANDGVIEIQRLLRNFSR